MEATIARKANLVDAMILIVALALGLTGGLRQLPALGEWYSMIKPVYRLDVEQWWTTITRKLPPQFLLIQGCVQIVHCFVVPLVPALILARLRRPRPPLRQIACQPGFAACVALSIGSIIVVDATYFGLVLIPPLVGAILPGGVVLLAWSILAAFRLWRPEPSWIDRLGRMVGAYWLATIPWSIWVGT